MYTLQFVMVGVFRGIRSKRPFQTPDKTFLTVAETRHSLHATYVSYFCHVQSIKTILRTSPVRPLQMFLGSK